MFLCWRRGDRSAFCKLDVCKSHLIVSEAEVLPSSGVMRGSSRVWPQMWAARRVRERRPDPPAPTSSRWPPARLSTREMRDTCATMCLVVMVVEIKSNSKLFIPYVSPLIYNLKAPCILYGNSVHFIGILWILHVSSDTTGKADHNSLRCLCASQPHKQSVGLMFLQTHAFPSVLQRFNPQHNPVTANSSHYINFHVSVEFLGRALMWW